MRIVEPKYLMLIGKNAFPGVTYENILIDVINASLFFSQKKSFMEHFKLIEEQSNGESDAYTSAYEMDFKLLVDEEVMKARYKNMPEVDYSQMSKGFVFSKTKEKVYDVPENKILSDIMHIDGNKIDKGEYKNNTERSIVKNIKKDKNLFLYYPYEFYDYPVNKAYFGEYLTNVFKTLLLYRDTLQLGKDTYVCIKVDSYFYIYEWENEKMIFRDAVYEYLCTNYMGLKSYAIY